MKEQDPLGENNYQLDYRLSDAYRKANLLDEKGLEELCPSYLELSEVSDRYQDEQLIGRGGVKEVYKTYDNRTRRWIAMARLREDRGPAFYDHFVHEGWIVSSLDHPNIIKVHDLGVDSEGRPFFTMDLKGDSSLAKRLQDHEHADLQELLEIFLKVCDGVAYAHTRDILHLDLKPENIQIEDSNEVLVCDWGLGKKMNGEHFRQTETDSHHLHNSLEMDNMTLVGEIKGSPGYMAPEQVQPNTPKDQRTDIFALGCILHAIVTGEAPFEGDPEEILEQTVACRIEPFWSAFPHLKVLRGLEAIVMKALQKEPHFRYSSVAELQDDLRRYLNGFPTQAEAPGILSKSRLFLLRNRAQTLIAIAALVSLAVVSFYFVERVNRQQNLTKEQGQRAHEFEIEAKNAQIQYAETLAQSRNQESKFAQELANSANRLKNMGIFETPRSTVTEASRLATNALALDPNLPRANYELFSLNLIKLNFKKALEYEFQLPQVRKSYRTLATEFPNLNYNLLSRPSPELFAQVIATAREIDPNLNPLIERMISFDSECRSNKGSCDQVLGEFVKNINSPDLSFDLTTDSSRSLTRLRAEDEIKLICLPGGSGRCILRFFPCRYLVIESAAPFDLAQLNHHPVQVLDLRGCREIVSNQRIFLPNLTEVRIVSGQADPAFLRRRLTSQYAFNFSVEPPVQPIEK